MRKTFKCSYEELIERIVKDIMIETGIPVSVGMSYSKVLAKLANDKAKALQKKLPDKKTYKIGYREIERELKATLISKVWGIGANTTALLKKYLIQTAWDFCSQQDVWIKQKIGKTGLELKQELLGNIISPVNPTPALPKMVSRSASFKEFQTDKNYIKEQLNHHIHEVFKKLRQKELLTSCIYVEIRTKDFYRESTKINLTSPTNSEFEIMKQAENALMNMLKDNVIYRAVGFGAYKLTSAKERQISIFNASEVQKKQQLSEVWDKLETKFGSQMFKLGSSNPPVKGASGFKAELT